MLLLSAKEPGLLQMRIPWSGRIPYVKEPEPLHRERVRTPVLL
jgi:hypothetical protein